MMSEIFIYILIPAILFIVFWWPNFFSLTDQMNNDSQKYIDQLTENLKQKRRIK